MADTTYTQEEVDAKLEAVRADVLASLKSRTTPDVIPARVWQEQPSARVETRLSKPVLFQCQGYEFIFAGAFYGPGVAEVTTQECLDGLTAALAKRIERQEALDGSLQQWNEREAAQQKEAKTSPDI